MLVDFTGDGILDLITTDGTSGQNGAVNLLKGTGTGSFTKVGKLNTGGKLASAIAAADFSGDGKIDFVVANSDSANLSVFLHK
ncbi:MAG TPA: VCBS repeat-containing protein [Candidatus Binatia bacterium]|nr:VCBS repeat-containing protein [Candidatus Binatia bacterium]